LTGIWPLGARNNRVCDLSMGGRKNRACEKKGISCAYIPLICLLYRLRVDHIEHIFKCDRLAFLINEFFFLFSLGKRLSRVQKMKKKMVGTELRLYLM